MFISMLLKQACARNDSSIDIELAHCQAASIFRSADDASADALASWSSSPGIDAPSPARQTVCKRPARS
jgi:hypothetical protein